MSTLNTLGGHEDLQRLSHKVRNLSGNSHDRLHDKLPQPVSRIGEVTRNSREAIGKIIRSCGQNRLSIRLITGTDTHRRSRESMEESPSLFHSSGVLAHVALNQANIGIAIYDQSGEFQFVNRKFAVMIRSNPVDVLNKSIWEVRQDITKANFEEHWEKFEPGQSSTCEDELIMKLSGTLPTRIHATRIKVGNDYFQLESIENIRSELTRRKELRSFKKAVVHAGHAVLMTDVNGTIQYANPAFEKITGYQAEEVIGKTPRILKSGRHGEQFYEELWETILTGKVWKGELVNRHKNGTLYHLRQTIAPILNDEGDIIRFVAINTDITHEKNRLQEIKHRAEHDPLTGLINRTGFKEMLSGAIQKREKNPDYNFAVIFLDLDGFKQVNDYFGHKIGDRVLEEIARRFEKAIRSSDTLARYGGDEFVFLIDQFDGEQELRSIAERIMKSLGESFDFSKDPIQLSASLGIVVPDLDSTGEKIIRKADKMMYMVKSEGGDGYLLSS